MRPCPISEAFGAYQGRREPQGYIWSLRNQKLAGKRLWNMILACMPS
jgi:hypothetical protein